MLRFILNYIFLLGIVNCPNMYIQYISTTYMFGQLRNISWVNLASDVKRQHRVSGNQAVIEEGCICYSWLHIAALP